MTYNYANRRAGVLLVTGGLGIIGRDLVPRLIAAGHRLRLVLRSANGQSAEQRLAEFLDEVGLPANAAEAVAGDLGSHNLGLDRQAVGRVVDSVYSILHIAGSTRFDATADGEPFATNVAGTRRLLEFAERTGIGHFLHVSTAYVAGRVTRSVDPADTHRPSLFTNAYEKSKWQGEQLGRAFAERTGATLTILRPGIVVGRHDDGSIHRFNGLYRVLRTLDTLRARWTDRHKGQAADLGLVLPGRANYTPAVVPLDWCGRLMAAIIDDPACHGQTWPILHPAPPTVRELRDWVDAALEMHMGWISDEPDAPQPDSDNVWQRAFDGQVESLRQYFGPGPTFQLGLTAGLIERLGLTPPPLDAAYCERLLAYGRARRWGRSDATLTSAVRQPAEGDFAAVYFQRFLPERMPHSTVARVAAMTVTMGFAVDGAGRWDLTFNAGRLTAIHVGGRREAPDVLYRLEHATLAEVIDGHISPQGAFLDDRVRIEGDVELALKLAMIFNQFMVEHPTTVAELRNLSDTDVSPGRAASAIRVSAKEDAQ